SPKDHPTPNFSDFSELFTVYIGTQVKTMYNLRLSVASDICTVFEPPSDPAQETALRAQTGAGLYGNSLRGVLVMMRRGDWKGYARGRSANQGFIKRCKMSTEFHFDDIETQLKNIGSGFPEKKDGEPVLNEGDFFITRHSNLPETHVVFHLVIDDENIGKSELTSSSALLIGYRNILKVCNRCDIHHLTLPLLLLPDATTSTNPSTGFSSTVPPAAPLSRAASTSSLSSAPAPAVFKMSEPSSIIGRAETVLKCTKGYLTEQGRLDKHASDSSGVDRR
ncbi:hypothetical protein HDV05_001856, partial [Chytridiales sp. JEL 0842]